MSAMNRLVKTEDSGQYPRGSGPSGARDELTGFETAKVNRSQRSNQGGQAGGGFGSQGNSAQGSQSAPQDDPWGIPATSNASSGWGNGPDSEPPF